MQIGLKPSGSKAKDSEPKSLWQCYEILAFRAKDAILRPPIFVILESKIWFTGFEDNPVVVELKIWFTGFDNNVVVLESKNLLTGSEDNGVVVDTKILFTRFNDNVTVLE
jgi:hypothetical protein